MEITELVVSGVAGTWATVIFCCIMLLGSWIAVTRGSPMPALESMGVAFFGMLPRMEWVQHSPPWVIYGYLAIIGCYLLALPYRHYRERKANRIHEIEYTRGYLKTICETLIKAGIPFDPKLNRKWFVRFRQSPYNAASVIQELWGDAQFALETERLQYEREAAAHLEKAGILYNVYLRKWVRRLHKEGVAASDVVACYLENKYGLRYTLRKRYD